MTGAPPGREYREGHRRRGRQDASGQEDRSSAHEASPSRGRAAAGARGGVVGPSERVNLLVVCALVTFEAVSRLVHPVAVTGGIVVTVAAVGVAVNVSATWVMARANCDSINVRGASE